MEKKQCLVFVHHFPTHSIVWEIFETDWDSLEAVYPPYNRRYMFVDRDGVIWLMEEPTMKRRSHADKYAENIPSEYPYFDYEVFVFEN